jgi:hypothetical protein
MLIEVCKGQAGLALYVDGTRVAGVRDNGLMTIVLSANVPDARAEAAEKALHELTEPISDAGHTTADGFRHELAECRKERDMLKAALERRGEIVFGKEGD